MAAPLGTVEIPVFIRFDGLEHQVGTIELDVMGEVTPQVKSAERAIAHALAPCETEQAAPEDTAALPWGDATPYEDDLPPRCLGRRAPGPRPVRAPAEG